jgi:hypothetical protein
MIISRGVLYDEMTKESTSVLFFAYAYGIRNEAKIIEIPLSISKRLMGA